MDQLQWRKARQSLRPHLPVHESLSPPGFLTTNSTHANAKGLRQCLRLLLLICSSLLVAVAQLMRVRDFHPGQVYFTFPTLASNCAPVTELLFSIKEDGSADACFIPAELPVPLPLLIRRLLPESPDSTSGWQESAMPSLRVLRLSFLPVSCSHSPLRTSPRRECLH